MAHATKFPAGDQAQSAGPDIVAIRCVDPLASRMNSESPRVYASRFPSGAGVAEVIASAPVPEISGRAGPPPAGALNTPARERKKIREPSGDHTGFDSEAAVSPVSRKARPSPTDAHHDVGVGHRSRCVRHRPAVGGVWFPLAPGAPGGGGWGAGYGRGSSGLALRSPPEPEPRPGHPRQPTAEGEERERRGGVGGVFCVSLCSTLDSLRSALANSAAVANRSAGSFCSAVCTASATCGGIVLRRVRRSRPARPS